MFYTTLKVLTPNCKEVTLSSCFINHLFLKLLWAHKHGIYIITIIISVTQKYGTSYISSGIYRKIDYSFTQAWISILFPMLIHTLADTEKFTNTYILYTDYWYLNVFLVDPPLILTHLLLEWVNSYSMDRYVMSNEVKHEGEDWLLRSLQKRNNCI